MDDHVYITRPRITRRNTLGSVLALGKEIKALGGEFSDLPRAQNFICQTIIVFPNGYGASVIEGFGSKGLELGVIKLDESHPYGWDLCYDTPVTDDVIGYLNENRLLEILKEISLLPKPEN